MFYIRAKSINNGHAGAFVAHLLQSGTDVHLGMVENSGYGKTTTFLGASPHVDGMVLAVAEHFSLSVPELMDYYVDIANDYHGGLENERRLIRAIASYKPE